MKYNKPASARPPPTMYNPVFDELDEAPDAGTLACTWAATWFCNPVVTEAPLLSSACSTASYVCCAVAFCDDI
jgi:hypothetical protein